MVRKLKNKVSSYQNRLSNKSSAREMEEKLKAKNTCIVALMEAMDNYLNVPAKVKVVNALSQDNKIQNFMKRLPVFVIFFALTL